MYDLGQYKLKAESAAQLVRAIESAVARGVLTPGQKLPSVRSLATQVDLSPATVAAALAELRRGGVIITEERRGMRVAQAPPSDFPRASLPVPPGVRDLSSGNPDPALLPDLGRALTSLQLPIRLYGEPAVIPQLLTLAGSQLRDDGIHSDHVCVLSGALDAVERVLAVHLRPGQKVAVENPGYAALFHLLRSRGLALMPVAVDEHGMRPEELEVALARGARAVLITPRGQNPTGAALDAKRAGELRTVIGGHHDVLVIEDDHLGILAGTELHTTLPAAASWASVRSVAKALGPDLRMAILAADEHTLAHVERHQALGPGWVSHILQRLLVCLWSDPQVSAQTERARQLYAERRRMLLECLRGHSLNATANSGLNVWVTVAEESTVLAGLLQRGWLVAPGAPYRLGGAAPAIRITVSTLDEHESKQLADDLDALSQGAALARSG